MPPRLGVSYANIRQLHDGYLPIIGAVAVTIKDLEEHTLNGEPKYVLCFKGKEKGLVLNRTNWDLIEEMHGDSDDWPGKQIILVADRTTFQGRRVDCIRVRPPAKTPKAATLNKSPAGLPAPESEDLGEGLSDADPNDLVEF